MKEALRTSVETAQPPIDWKDQVRRRVAEVTADEPDVAATAGERPAARQSEARWRRQFVPLAAAAAVALMLAVLLWRYAREVVVPAHSRVIVVTRGVATRGEGLAAPGDLLSLEASQRGAVVELRVYFNDSEVVLRCSDQAPCVRRGGTSLRRRSRWIAAAAISRCSVVSRTDIPPPTASLDADSGSALDGAARVTLGESIEVR